MTPARALSGAGLALLLAGCGGRDSAPEPSASWLGEPLAAVPTSALTAGPRKAMPEIENPYADDSGALTQGRQLFNAFNCSGCHGSAGGGGMGPPLADADWFYGGSDAQIYATIIQGRPNGMPSFGQSLSGEAVWKLAAFVKSLGPGTGENEASRPEATSRSTRESR